MSLIERFTSRAGHVIRVQGTNDEPLFCAKDVCEALSIVNYRNKVARLDEDEKHVSIQWTSGQRRRMVFVTEPGLYKIILTCRDATTQGTPAHAFTRWVTHEVLPSIRREKEYKLREQLALETREEKGRRLWVVVREMNIWSYNARRKHFSKVCTATREFWYTDEFNSPHVNAESLEECRAKIRRVMSEAIVDSVPSGQRLMTDYYN